MSLMRKVSTCGETGLGGDERPPVVPTCPPGVRPRSFEVEVGAVVQPMEMSAHWKVSAIPPADH